VRAVLISVCYLISLTGINIIDVMNIVGSFFNLGVGIYFPVAAADQILFYIRYFEAKGELTPLKKKGLMALLWVMSLLSVWSVLDGIYSVITKRNSG